jgi:hypothetical protein
MAFSLRSPKLSCGSTETPKNSAETPKFSKIPKNFTEIPKISKKRGMLTLSGDFC